MFKVYFIRNSVICSDNGFLRFSQNLHPWTLFILLLSPSYSSATIRHCKSESTFSDHRAGFLDISQAFGAYRSRHRGHQFSKIILTSIFPLNSHNRNNIVKYQYEISLPNADCWTSLAFSVYRGSVHMK